MATIDLSGEIVARGSAVGTLGQLQALEGEVVLQPVIEGNPGPGFLRELFGVAVLQVGQESKANVDASLCGEVVLQVAVEGRLGQQYSPQVITGANFLFSGQPQVGGGMAITWLADVAEAPTYWSLIGIDRVTGWEEPPHGTLKWGMVKTDKSGRAVNYYVAPKDPAQVGKVDRVIVRKLQE